MTTLKFICFVIAVITTSLYLNNIVVDFTRAMTWGKSFNMAPEEKENGRQAEPDAYALFRFVLSIIMGITWGVVFIL